MGAPPAKRNKKGTPPRDSPRVKRSPALKPRAARGRSSSARGGRWRLWALVGLLGALGFFSYAYVTLPDASALRTQNPKTTALIEQRAAEAREAHQKARRRQQWVGLSSMSKHLIAAVILSEDSGFFGHDGVDLDGLQKALLEAWEKKQLGRGASTLTQQLAKNLWLSTDRSLVRKLKEVWLARRLEAAMSKGRILTLYLNVVEWGEGVYGIEAAAQEHFGLGAAQLSPAQSAILAAMLPAPRKRTPHSHSKALRRRAHWIIDQLQYIRRLAPEQAAQAHGEIDVLLGWKQVEPHAPEPDEDAASDAAPDAAPDDA